MNLRRHVSLAAMLAIASRASAQISSFVTTLGHDTLSLEQYRRVGDTITGDWVTVYGGIMYHHYTITLRPDGTVSRYTLSLHRVSGKEEGTINLAMVADSLIVTSTMSKDSIQRLAVPAEAAFFSTTVAPFEAMVMRARAIGQDSTAIVAVPVFGPYQRNRVPVVFFDGDSIWFGNPRAPIYASVDRAGMIHGLSARMSTTRTETRRVGTLDIAAVISHFPNVPDDTPILGVPAISPRATTRATIGGATIMIDYGRPSVRGRNVFSHGVLGDTLWRAGANAATQFTATSDVVVDGQTLAAGTYSLWIHTPPDNSSYELVFNSQSGQWGTEHHFERDVAHVPLQVHRLSASQEQLSYAIDDGVLRLRWANLELSTPLAVAR
jgi:hypothetical protein